jgi:hypothetical protein
MANDILVESASLKRRHDGVLAYIPFSTPRVSLGAYSEHNRWWEGRDVWFRYYKAVRKMHGFGEGNRIM